MDRKSDVTPLSFGFTVVALAHIIIRPSYGVLIWVAVFPGGLYLFGVGALLNKLVKK